jgi:hypothetical protein
MQALSCYPSHSECRRFRLPAVRHCLQWKDLPKWLFIMRSTARKPFQVGTHFRPTVSLKRSSPVTNWPCASLQPHHIALAAPVGKRDGRDGTDSDNSSMRMQISVAESRSQSDEVRRNSSGAPGTVSDRACCQPAVRALVPRAPDSDFSSRIQQLYD